MTRVLIVEDNPAVLESIVLDLELRGYEVLAAGDGQIALNLLSADRALPDIIVSDIAMPNMDGYTLLQTVQQDNRLARIPFIFLTAYGSESDIRQGKKLGVDDYLTKPFRPDDLVVAMENKLRRMARLQELAEKRVDQVREDLMHMISHELRTPLTSVYGGVEVLADSLSDTPAEVLESTLQLIRSGAQRMYRLVEQILLLMQIDEGKLAELINTYGKPCDLEAVVYSASQLVQVEKERRNVTIEIYANESNLDVKGMFDLLAQVVAEVIRNAVMFSPHDSVVEVNIFRDANQGVIVVQDYGSGIPAEELPNITKRFYQFNRKQTEQQGAGLGLAIVKEYMQIHGGEYNTLSEEGRGTQVELRFPLMS